MPSSSSDSESNCGVNDEEAALLFPSNNNFNSASFDPVGGGNIQGVAFGIRYEKSRRERKKKSRKQRLERAHAFDIDDGNEYASSSSFPCVSNVLIIIFVCTVASSILDRRQRRKTKNVPEGNFRIHHGSLPSSRWGHRFDDDDDDSSFKKGERDELTIAYQSGYKGTAHIAKYHTHNNNPGARSQLTPNDIELDIEEWEKYEAEVSHLLSGTGSDWDIYFNKKKSSEYSENTDSDENAATNTTQWDKPKIGEGVALFGYDYVTGENIVLEAKKITPTVDVNQDFT
eukprot:CCRYP_018328-RA/>CCRYP_018328-RA protein AED:0.04 eAED:0.04 QI:64/1/1/1/0/0/2/102/285